MKILSSVCISTKNTGKVSFLNLPYGFLRYSLIFLLCTASCPFADFCLILPVFKGIVQRDLTWIETRLKRSVLMNYIVAKFAFWILREHHQERSTKPVSASKQQLNRACWMSSQNPANELRNLASAGWWSYGTTPVPYNHQLAQISRDSWILSLYGTILHRTIILRSRYSTVLSSAGAGRIFHFTDLSS